MQRLALLLAGAGSSSLMAGAALAQSAPPTNPTTTLSEIVVTAQRRSQSIQDVGIAVTALSGEQMAKLGITNTQQIAQHVPSLLFDGGSGGGLNAFVSIRGVSQVDVSEHQEAPNAVYLDEVYVPTPSMVGFPVYDLARAEALRGPQGTLFGRNSTGGLLQFVTNDPSDTYKGFVDAQYGNYSTYRLEGAVGGPITDRLSFRLAGFRTRGDGYFKNNMPGGDNSFETNSFGLRGKLKAELGDSWTALLTGSINESPKHHEGVYKFTPAYSDANGVTQFLPPNVDFYGTGSGNDPYGYRDSDPSFHHGSFNSDGRYLTKKYDYVTLKLEGPVGGGATLTSISNYSRGKLDYSEDADATPNQLFTYYANSDTQEVSQEIRLTGQQGRLNWTTGAYFLALQGSYAQEFGFLYLDATTPFDPVNQWQQRTRSYAVFAQAEYKLTETLKATVGLRLTHDYKHFRSIVFDSGSSGNNMHAPLPPTLLYQFSTETVGDLATMKHGDWAGKIQLDYKPNPDLLIYAGVSRGIRSGGFNSSPDGTIPLTSTPFSAETVYSYETGTKLRLLENRASLRVSAFYYDYHNFQGFNFQNLVAVVANNPAHFYGAEAEFSITPMERLNISFGGSALRGKVEDLSTPQGVQNVEPVKAPHYTFNGIISKTFDVADGEINLQYDFNYISKSSSNLVPSRVTELPASWMQNARVSYGRPDEGWEVFLWCRNLTNAARKNFAYDNVFLGGNLASYAPPRMYGVGARKTF